jgi:hypothetical protein
MIGLAEERLNKELDIVRFVKKIRKFKILDKFLMKDY